MTQAFYNKWRPHRWEDVIGQEHVVQTLQNAVTSGRVAHAQLFAGPRGTGKTTTARLLAKAVNCTDADKAKRPCNQCVCCKAVDEGRFLDLIEIDAASNTSVEDVRDLRDKINFKPNLGSFKVYIVDEVHMLSTAAFNALLKTLEEPPPHAMFILATTEVHKIPATVLSRCQRHEFRRIPVGDIVAYLKHIVQEEGLQADEEALYLVARQATGAMRDAVSLLDQLASTGQKVTLEMAQEVLGTATNQAVLELWDAVLAGDAAAGLSSIHRTLDAGTDPRQYARQVVEYLRNLLLVKMGNAGQVDVTKEMREQMARHAQGIEVADLLHSIQVFNRAATEGKANWMPALPIEMALIETIEKPAAAEVEIPKSPTPAQEKAKQTVKGPKQVKETQSETPTTLFQSALAEPPAPVDSQAARDFEEKWSQALLLLKQKKSQIHAVVISAKSRRLENNILTLGFPSEIVKKMMEKNDNLQVFQEILKHVFNEEILIRCIVLTGKQTTPPPGVDSDGMVASALRDLGGEIVDIQ
jgi:DNA polymerase III subunit gamma/tau